MTGVKLSSSRPSTDRGLEARSLSDLVRWADEKPEAPALLSAGQSAVSFDLFVRRIAAVANLLRAAGLGPGQVVAVAMPDGPGLITTLLGAMETAAAAPMDWQLTESEFRARLTLLPASIVLTRSVSDGLPNGHAAAAARKLGIEVVELDFPPDGTVVFTRKAPPDVAQRTRCAPENCAIVLQTSATSGEPKLVPLSHANLHAMCVGVLRGLDLRAEDRYMSIMPLHHILGLSSALGQLMVGGSVACTGFDALKFAGWIGQLNPTWYAAGPTLHQAILEIVKQDPEPFHRSPLRFIRCGSGAGSEALLNELERILQVVVINGYGLTEVGCATNTSPHLPRKPESVGRTIGPEIAIMDALGNLLPAGSEGEVVLRGEAVMPGYLGAEEANRSVFRDGWFRSGDLGRMDHDGDLFITGRIKEIINRGGETISPLEIDHAIAEHPGILRAASFGLPHPTLGEDIVAAVALRPGVSLGATEVRTFLAGRLSRSKVPGRIWFVEAIPLSASGKPRRDVLRAQFHAIARSQQSLESLTLKDESSGLLPRIGEIWRRVLDSDAPQPEDNFFAMGGDSLSATRLFALLQQELDLEVAPLDLPKFFDSPTFLQLVQILRARVPNVQFADSPGEMRFKDTSAVCLQHAGNGPPIFFFPGEAGEPWYLRHLARSLGNEQPFFALTHQLADAADFSEIAGQFVTLISRTCLSGPIVLAGHCYGGIMAYEVAQQMLGMSRAGIAVVLVDVGTPGYPKLRVNSYVTHLPSVLGEVLRGQGRKFWAELVEHLRFLRALSKKNGNAKQVLLAPKAEASDKEQVSALSPAAVVMRTYTPLPFPGPLANVLAGDVEISERVLEDSRKGWRELARGPFHQGSIGGHHISVFDAENAPTLAHFIQSALENLGVISRSAIL